MAVGWRGRVGLGLLLVLGGCRAAPPPKAASGDFGIVRAATEDHAVEGRALLDEVVPAVRAVLPETRERSIEVWLQHEIEIYRGSPYPDHVAGMAEYGRGRIYLRDRDAELKLHLAHEIVHLLLGDAWETLPPILEEGLCDHVAYAIVGDPRSMLRAWRLLEAAGSFGGIDATLEFRLPRTEERRARSQSEKLRLGADKVVVTSLVSTLELDDGEVFKRSTVDSNSGLYGVGYFVIDRIVDRHGYEGLHDLAKRARAAGMPSIPSAWILEAAELRDDEDSLRAAVGASFLPHELRHIVILCSNALAATLIDRAGDLYPQYDSIGFLRAARPSLSLPTSRGRMPLIISDPFVAAVVERWGSTEK